MSSYFHLFGFWYYVDVRFGGSAVLSGCWVPILFVISGRGKEWKWLLIKLISTVWDWRQKYLSFHFKDFNIIFVHCSFILTSNVISTIQSIPCKWNNICLFMQWRHFNHTWMLVTLLCLLCGVIVTSDKVKRDWMGHNRTHVRIWLWNIFVTRQRLFCSKWHWYSDADNITDTSCIHWADRAHCPPCVTCSPWVYGGPVGYNRQ